MIEGAWGALRVIEIKAGHPNTPRTSLPGIQQPQPSRSKPDRAHNLSGSAGAGHHGLRKSPAAGAPGDAGGQ